MRREMRPVSNEDRADARRLSVVAWNALTRMFEEINIITITLAAINYSKFMQLAWRGAVVSPVLTLYSHR